MTLTKREVVSNMKLNEEQYRELVDKLASEIVEEGVQKEASEEENKEDKVKEMIEAKKKEIAEKNEKEAMEAEAQELAEKAAAVYEYALRKIAACEEYYADGMQGQEACVELLKEAGVITEEGFNKEAAEANEEVMEMTTKIASFYDEAECKIVAAQEKYAEAVEEANAALEVLAELGYELNN